MVGVTRWDRVKKKETQLRVEIEETLAEKVNRRVLQLFGYVERMD